MNYTLKQGLTPLALFTLFTLAGMEQPRENIQPTFQCKVPFGNDEFPDEIPVKENAYYTTLLYNENDTAYYYEPDPENPSQLKRKKYDATFDLVYHNDPQPQTSQTQSSFYFGSRQSRINNNSLNFSQRSAYYAQRDFAIDNYLHVYNQLDDYGQAQYAQENERLHELAMRKIAYDNQPPFRQRVKESFEIIGQKLSTTKDRVSSWWRGGSDDNPEKEFDASLSTQKEYHSTALIEQAESPHTDYAKACLQQQANRPSEDPFNTETMLSKLEKKSAELSQENSDENQKEKEQKIEEKREVIFSSDTYVVSLAPSNSAEQNSPSSSKETESLKKPSPFPAEKPKQDVKDKKPHGIPQEIKEKYEEYKKQETKKHDPALKSTQPQQPASTGNVTAVNKEPIIDVINKDSKEFMAKLNLPQTTSNTNVQSARPAAQPPAATSIPTSPLSQINNYNAYASSAPTRTPSAQTQSLQTQRQQYSNQISQAARRESSTARAWGGSQERRQLEADRSKIESQIRYEEAVANYSGGGGYSREKVKYYPRFDENHFAKQSLSNISNLIESKTLAQSEKLKINNTWAEIRRKSEHILPEKISDLDINNSNHRKAIQDCDSIVNAIAIFLQNFKFERDELLPLLRANNFEAVNKLLSKPMHVNELICLRRKWEKDFSKLYENFKYKVELKITKKATEEYKKLGYVEWFFSWNKYGKIKQQIKEKITNKLLDKISHQKNLKHQQKLAAEKLERELHQAEIERQLEAERAEQERIQKALELAQKKETNAKLVGEKLAYEAKKIRLQQEFELDQSKKRLDNIIKKINAPHFHTPEKDFAPIAPQTTFDQIELIVEQPAFSWQEVIDQPALDFISSNPHRAKRTDPQIISELIADPATPQNIVDLLEQARFLQDTVDNETLSDLSSTATELILLGEMISKKMAEKSFARSQEEAKQYEKLQTEIVRISTFIIDCVNIATKEIEKKRAEHYELYQFVSKHPIETIKIVTPILAHVTQKIVRLAVVLAPYDDFGPDLFVQELTDGTISDVQKIPLEELTVLVDASGKSLVNFLMHTPRREQVRGVVDFGFDLVAQHLIFKSCSMLKSTLRSNFIDVNALKAMATTAEERAVVDAAIELASQQKKLVYAVEHACEGNVAPTAENIRRTQRVNEILDLATEFSQSEKALEIEAVLENKNLTNNPSTIQSIDKASKIDSLKYAKDRISQFAKISEKDSVWSKITPTQEFWPHTNIPKSFIIDCQGKKIWVGANATDHLMEYIAPLKKRGRGYIDPLRSPWNIPASEYRLSQQMILDDFFEALELAVQKGIHYEFNGVMSKNWKIVFSEPAIQGGCVQIHHIENILWKKH